MGRIVIMAVFILCFALRASRQTEVRDGGKIILVENQVDRSPGGAGWQKASLGDAVKWQEHVRTGELSRGGIELSTGGVLRVSEHKPASATFFNWRGGGPQQD